MAKKKPTLNIVSGNSNEHKEFSAKNFSSHNLISLKPITPPQTTFFNEVEKETPIIFQVGSAGTGKTIIALYAAMADVLDKSTPRNRVIIIRSAVQAREIGFLKGDEREKNDVYEAPYKSICHEILNFKKDKFVDGGEDDDKRMSDSNYNNLKAKGLIEFHTTSFLRGQTFDNVTVVFDEFQNAKYEEISTVLTRLGVNSRIVFCGDHKQSDLHKKGDNSGFHRILKVMDHMPEQYFSVIHYKPEDIVRSGIVKEFLLAEERMETIE